MAGSVIYLGGLLGISFLPENAQPGTSGVASPGALFALLMLLWGVVMGTGAALCCTVALSVLAHWFDRRRGLAAGVVFVGSSIGGAVFPLILRSTFGSIGWAWSMRIILLIVAALLAIGNVLIRGRFTGKKGYGAIEFRCFREWSFVWTTLGCFSQYLAFIPMYRWFHHDRLTFGNLTGSESVHFDSRVGDGADMGSCKRVSGRLDLYSCCCDEWVGFLYAPAMP